MKRTGKQKEAEGTLALVSRALLIGYVLGLLLAVSAASWVWLEMRVNAGHLIPGATVVCPVLACWKKKVFPYSAFLTGQALLITVLLARYGFDPGALWSVPAYLFREGFHAPGLALGTAGLLAAGAVVAGNVWWLWLSRYQSFN